ncbi:MAG: Beta-glucosidase A [Methanobacteriota archaeon]|nr:MAG: Beta-glucosidase A [Euryarchaeota archaeon]
MWEYLLLSAISGFAAFKLALILYRRRTYPEPHYDWNHIKTDSLSFPDGFYWGSATAAHQVEGNLTNNWTVHEERKNLERSGAACDHWNRWKDDFQMMSDLGLNSYRFSIEWSRLEPEPGQWNKKALDVYSEMIDDLIQRGIRPVVTLHHFSHPKWWEEKGGFANQDNLPEFLIYCERVFDALSDRVETWVTINEPTVFSAMGYTLGMFPPGKRSIRLTLRVMRNVMRGHAIVYRSLKKKRPEARIGVAKNVTLFDPRNRWSPIDWPLSRLLEWLWNGAWRNGIRKGRMLFANIPEAKDSLDFVGLNYYTHFLTGLFIPTRGELQFPKRKHEVATEFGYPMYAEGFRRAIEFVAPLNVPIEITENGVADAKDALRPEHLMRHLWIVSEAINDGFDIRSYHHWSLMDNFEWAEGYSMCFGLHHVNFETQERTLRPSGELYRDIIAAN